MLSTPQITALFHFCEHHHVQYYDLQVELVDHLANAIEALMEADPGLEFGEALKKVYAQFGVLGFSQIVKSRRMSLEKQYRRMRWRSVRAYLDWPKAALTMCLALGFLLAHRRMDISQYQYFDWVVRGSLLVLEVVVVIKLGLMRKKQQKQLLATEVSRDVSVFFAFVTPLFLSNHINYFRLTAAVDYIVYVFVAIFCLIALLAFRNVVVEADRRARTDYPEAYSNL